MTIANELKVGPLVMARIRVKHREITTVIAASKFVQDCHRETAQCRADRWEGTLLQVFAQTPSSITGEEGAA
ncbi:MAG: hypothetical protein AAF215_05460 [Cyanobacteria bacterium P01_A01_bin.123]